jgi:signal transduction histidine kinase/CheY-like chemotaxis protein/HAMP domain-containing protein
MTLATIVDANPKEMKLLLSALTDLKLGDFSTRLPGEWTGVAGKIADTFNEVVGMNQAMSAELERLCREVGKEGKIQQRADRRNFRGAWSGMVTSVNTLVEELVRPTSEMSRVIGAVAKGDLSQTADLDSGGRPLEGEFLKTARTVNTMVNLLGSFTSEVTRVAREVGTEGKLGGQALVPGVAGTWKDLTDNVNFMASNLTSQVRNIADITTAVANGDFSRKITADVRGEILQLKEKVNTMVDQLSFFTSEVTRVAREVGVEGRLGGQAIAPGAAGTWKELTDNVNFMASNLTSQVRNIADITTAVANGDFSRKITADVSGEVLQLKEKVNTMVDQLSFFTSEVTRVAREVGTEGKLGGQAIAPGAAGTWKDLTDNVNFMASNLTSQVRNIADVTTAVANGDFSKKISAEVRGEFLQLKEKVNTMVDQLSFFTSEVTRVAREVGVEGRLGGQAIATGAAGTWKDLTDNVNQLAANLTTQVRAIAEVAISVTKGDLTRSISVTAQGEVGTLKDTLNQMIANLRATTQKNADEDWLKTNLARFTRMLVGQTDLQMVSTAILTELSKVVAAQHGVFYIADSGEGKETRLKMLSAFAYQPRKDLAREFALGEGLVGQCAKDKEPILITDPPANYIKISSGLGEDKPANIVVLPILFESQMKAVLELASFEAFSPTHLAFLVQLMEGIGIVLNTLEASLRTENLLKSLQVQQEELRKTNQALEDKADQLALTSKYKSEFLSNMSHELRTPLNSMLILSQQLAEDSKNLTAKQIEYARTIHASGGDLLTLINDILDLSKVESGTLALEMEDLSFNEIKHNLDRVFRHLAEGKGLKFDIELDSGGLERIHTDSKRLEQILRNLLSNAFKFTVKGGVSLKVQTVTSGWTVDHPVLSRAKSVAAFTVSDSGIGIPSDKQKIIFEAFQQADSGTSRKYGGTGLGLSISRELAKLLGCQLSLASSAPGKGSTFVLYVPEDFLPQNSPVVSSKPVLFSDANPHRLPQTEADLPSEVAVEELVDDRKAIQKGDRVLLIVEDDRAFAMVILEFARLRGFKGVIATSGTSAIRLAGEFRPTAITLDIHLPDMDGWGVLARFKNDPSIRHVPIELISIYEDRYRGMRQGAMAFLTKPVARRELSKALETLQQYSGRAVKNLLLLSSEEARRRALAELLGGEDVKMTVFGSGAKALAALQAGGYDCMVMEVPDKESEEVLQVLAKSQRLATLPIIVVHLQDELPQKTVELLRQASAATVMKEVKSTERLLDETALYLHRKLEMMPKEKRDIIDNLYSRAPVLSGKTALVVDDDIRNIFAMTSLLENSQMQVLSAESGASALEILAKHPDVDVVLMDIMMPDMDGYDTMKAIRKDERLRAIPIIALTAKAMKGDREKCIESGASDYITKPVDSTQLLSMMGLWLHR